MMKGTEYILISLTVMAITATVGAGVASNRAERANEFVNLQVLPKDISARELQAIMVDEFQDGLGVGCGYCHARKGDSLLLDYASDEKPEKQIARQMMKMTLELNKNYFLVKDPRIGDASMSVNCFSCHNGTAHPVH